MENDLKTFGIIANFVKELDPLFGNSQRTIKLYARLIERTALVHTKPIQKHLNAFRSFCTENQDAILTKDRKLIKLPKIVYSSNVYLDMNEIFSRSDRQTQNTIWKYLLTISALLDPTSKAKQILKESKDEKGGNEAEFLGDIISRVESSVDPNSENPMAAVGSILQSGIFTDLISGMSSGLSDGSLDLSNLIGTVQKLVVGMQGTDPGDVDSSSMNMLSGMMGTLNSAANKVEEIDENKEIENKPEEKHSKETSTRDID